MPIKISFKKNIIESKIKNYILFTNENFKIIGLEKTSLSKQSNTINKTINNNKLKDKSFQSALARLQKFSLLHIESLDIPLRTRATSLDQFQFSFVDQLNTF